MNADYKKGFNDALSEIKGEIDGLVKALVANCNPDPLGSLEECLADSEIQAFNLVLDIIKEKKK